MPPKAVLLTINHAPHGSVLYAEGLRVAMGVMSTTDEHTIEVVFVGDGAYAALEGVDRSLIARYVATLAEFGCGLKVEEESLTGAGIRPDEVAPDFTIVPRSTLLTLLDAADFVVDF